MNVEKTEETSLKRNKSITKEAAEKYLNKMPEQFKTLADFQHLEKAAKRKVTWRKTIPL